ncbi:hypothetical protein [Billgrantia kenyensis]|uniref:Uncharacterized protein n=1 Tax=Billgrantia kenyensis TaxID=321266 RepID=A0A7W0AFE4_9GAMM|nr:hypothetical protein [Halomonas kenyensis]MBA2781103.1 hypothetical protein [Halomonas kenyensis]MCG6663816.1 hypothetical protein [Halomonas kenyensis]
MSTAAAWVQAIGSIGAIGAAIWISRLDIKWRNKEKKEYRLAILELARLAHRELLYLDETINEDYAYLHGEGVSNHDLNRHLLALKTVSLETFPSKKSFVDLHEFERLCERMSFLIDSLKNDLAIGRVSPDFTERSEEIKSAADEVMERLTHSLKRG